MRERGGEIDEIESTCKLVFFLICRLTQKIRKSPITTKTQVIIDMTQSLLRNTYFYYNNNVINVELLFSLF